MAVKITEDPTQWLVELPYSDGNGKTRKYCQGCVIDRVAASPAPAKAG